MQDFLGFIFSTEDGYTKTSGSLSHISRLIGAWIFQTERSYGFIREIMDKCHRKDEMDRN
jgi:hypothetical protein